MPQGYMSLVLNAHFPYIEDDDILMKSKLFSIITNTYLPFLELMNKLNDEGQTFSLTLSLSPTLINILSQEKIKLDYEAYLSNSINASEKEIESNSSNPEIQKLLTFYIEKYKAYYDLFVHKYDGDILKAFKLLSDTGKLSLITTCATYAYIPLIVTNKASLKAQIGIAIDIFKKYFGQNPSGFWLPECGYAEEVEEYLLPHDIEYLILDSHGLIYANPEPVYGTFSPIITPSGICTFGRDAESSRQLWSNTDGLLKDNSYRRRYVETKNENYIETILYKNSLNPQSKELYDPDAANETAIRHASEFLSSKVKQIEYISDYMDKPPILLCPYDIELFGSWWYEGMIWLEEFIRQYNSSNCNFELTTPDSYLNRHPVMQVCKPCPSSWGTSGYNELWLNESNDWIFKHLKMLELKIDRLILSNPDSKGDLKLAIELILREFLLLQSSDYLFMLNSPDSKKEFALKKIKSHLMNSNKLSEQITNGNIDHAWISSLCQTNRLFSEMDFSISNFYI